MSAAQADAAPSKKTINGSGSTAARENWHFRARLTVGSQFPHICSLAQSTLTLTSHEVYVSGRAEVKKVSPAPRACAPVGKADAYTDSRAGMWSVSQPVGGTCKWSHWDGDVVPGE